MQKFDTLTGVMMGGGILGIGLLVLAFGVVTVTLSYYGPLVGSTRTATVTFRGAKGKTLSEVVANVRGREPLTLEPHSDTGPIPYPSYEVLTVAGINEVIEHRRMEPIFYITDDPNVRRKLGVDR